MLVRRASGGLVDADLLSFERALARRSDGWRVFGLIGRGYPQSLYKLYATRSKRLTRWWRFEGEASSATFDPLAYQRRVELNPESGGGASNVRGRTEVLIGLTCDPERPALVRALALLQQHAREQLEQERKIAIAARSPSVGTA